MYLGIKSFHIIFVVAWFAGLFYIFRLFVYHRQRSQNLEICDLLCTMERRLLHFIVFPASALTILSGIGMLYLNGSFLQQKWLWLKLILVFALMTYQGLSYWTYVHFRKRDFFLSEKACRFANEIPTLLLIGIVILVVLKPW